MKHQNFVLQEWRSKQKNGAKAMGKPVGTYLTIETPNLAMPDEKVRP